MNDIAKGEQNIEEASKTEICVRSMRATVNHNINEVFGL